MESLIGKIISWRWEAKSMRVGRGKIRAFCGNRFLASEQYKSGEWNIGDFEKAWESINAKNKEEK